MSKLCWLFGHKPPSPYRGGVYMPGAEYMQLKHAREDELGRVHFQVWGNCSRCGAFYQVGMSHSPQQGGMP